VPPPHGIPLAAGSHGDDIPMFYARLFPGTIFHPPRHSWPNACLTAAGARNRARRSGFPQTD